MKIKYLIWSFEHNAWWRAKENGYTTKIELAGEYILDRAQMICLSANRNNPKNPQEAIVPIPVKNLIVEI